MEKIDVNTLTAEQINFMLILHSGNARSKIIEALREYRSGNPEAADELLVQAEADLSVAHEIHFKLVQQEASGNKVEFALLLMHAEDHLMSTLSMKELVKELLEIFKEKKL
ncbi:MULTISPECIES: PTS lactose/cellobiose transporter subunit IIA [Bacillaceae]|uniref:PTS lactose/cellobiose transporter subunit IIA n=1 Tax=Bacillaceae TaxID=186817 RepID=UPI001E65B34C|nr:MULTISPECIES: PTS lactose/cellobiose transporter subunit IIA [Bacillaceae]MCE4050317.1 PTS lactose/cellobiose transporter subunit IIA [Bacillus sp. Au-Bac7]MCM3029552.1 PTS lactose/cellobiose transporter subunit IIA [Niallia sp. MER 6]MDL0435141.1 PTS lactose/cellobiose transporter subunit IIA [Niallia sp. SS-2023]UPO87091.1 PTS lactose/cellobiose transporter subunit IIA [Niallia sp. Man26]